jgi:hypothetical protein
LLSAGDGTVAGKSFSAALFADQLRLFNTHLRAYDKRPSELLDAHPDAPVMRSFPGIGPLVAATLISEMGEDRNRYPSAAALLADTGLAPVTRSSGRTRQVRFRYPANRRMRHAIDWWTFVATREDDWSRTRLRDRPRTRSRQVPRTARTRRPLSVRVRLQPHDFAEPARLGRFDLGHIPLLSRATAGQANRVEALVRGDPVQPGADRGTPLEPVECPPRREQRVLQSVLGVRNEPSSR